MLLREKGSHLSSLNILGFAINASGWQYFIIENVDTKGYGKALIIGDEIAVETFHQSDLAHGRLPITNKFSTKQGERRYLPPPDGWYWDHNNTH